MHGAQEESPACTVHAGLHGLPVLLCLSPSTNIVRSFWHCMQSIDRAHAALRPGSMRLAAGELLGANINRSPTAYLRNPEEASGLQGPCRSDLHPAPVPT